MSDRSDSFDSDDNGSDTHYGLEDLTDLDPSKPIEFGLFEHMNPEAAVGQGALKSFSVKEGSSALYSDRKSDYSVLADRLLWVDGYETTTKVGQKVKRGREMTLVVLKLVFSSLDPDVKFEHVKATLQLHDCDKRNGGRNEPVVEAWAPFRTMERSNTVVAQREKTDTTEASAKAGYSGSELSLGRGRENKISWELTDFDQGSSNEEISKVTNRRNGITWFMKQNKLLNQGVKPELWVSMLFVRPSAEPYIVDFSLYVRAGTLREVENKTKRFFGNAPDSTTLFSMTPWKQKICNSEGMDILKNIDLNNLGKLRDPNLSTNLNLQWGAGPADKAAAGSTAQSNQNQPQVEGEADGGWPPRFSLDRLAQAEARVAQAEARVAQVEARMALQDVTILQLQQKIMSLSA